ncbi:MAG: hypothetical protein ACRDRX_00320, partial [Pseudonocardiaceae bacterium]
TLNPLEVLEAGWFPVTELPAGILPAHRQLIETNTAWCIDGANPSGRCQVVDAPPASTSRLRLSCSGCAGAVTC